MRVCVAGGGLAGSLLAWRLARTTTWRIDLACGSQRPADATAASGGAVRGYETDDVQRRLAAASMAELLASPTLRRWAGYRPTGSMYLRLAADTAAARTVAAEVADVNAQLPGSATVVAADDLAALGVADVPDAAIAVLERDAGYVSPSLLRDAALADRATRRRVSVHPGPVAGIAPRDDGGIDCEVAGDHRVYDVVVLATGGWTAHVLRASSLPADGYRTKSIQYCIHTTGDWRPPHFVDEIAGAYGRPTADGGLLLGVPTDRWDVDPDRPPALPDLPDIAARRASARFPRLQLGPVIRRVSSMDCYADQPGLALRPVTASGHRLLTFAGGAGGSVKTVLAASDQAARQLVSAC